MLVDGDDFNEPIQDTARSILDGHIMLDRKLGHKNDYPAIDVLQSISRVMSAIATKEHKNLAGRLKNVLATYTEAEDVIKSVHTKTAQTKISTMPFKKLVLLTHSFVREQMRNSALKRNLSF